MTRLHIKRTLSLIFLVATCVSCAANKPQTLRGMSYEKVDVVKSDAPKSEATNVMKRYRQFIDEAPVNHPMYSDALNRLADLEMLEGDKKIFVENEGKFADAVAAMSEGRNGDGSDNYQNAINLYESLLKSNPKDRRADWVSYQLSRAYEQNGDLEGAVLTLQRLLKNYPRSQYVTESRFRIGEMSYSLRQFSQAENAYRMVLRDGRVTPYYDKSIYKLGWSLFKQERYRDALDQFFFALRLLPLVYGEDDRIQLVGLTQLERDLLQDIFRAINLSFSYLKGPESLAQYFQRNPDARLEYEMFHRLGDYYMAADRVEDAADTYALYVKRNGISPRAAQMQLLRVDVYVKAGFSQQSLQAREVFIERFASSQRFWDSLSMRERKVQGERVRRILIDLSEFYHSRAQKRKKPRDFVVATRWYETLVRMFPGEHTARQQLLLAELYYSQARYQQAILYFEKVAYDLPRDEKSSDAGYSALLAHEKLIAAQSTRKAERMADYVKSAYRFLSWFESDKRVLSVRATTSERLFKLERYDEAVHQAKLIIAKGDGISDKEFVSAHMIIGHVAFDKEDFVAAERSYNLVLSKKIDRRLSVDIKRKLSVSSFKIAERLRMRGDTDSAAAAFVKASNVSSDKVIRSRALFDAAVVYVNSDQWQKALPLLEKYYRTDKDGENVQSVLENMIRAYQTIKNPLKAADTMLLLAERPLSVGRKRELFWEASQIYKSEDRLNLSVSALNKYIKTYSSPTSQSIEAQYEVALIQHRQNKIRERDRSYQKILRSAKGKVIKDIERVRTIASEAAFVLAEKKFSAYQKLSLTLPLKRSLSKKKKAMDDALKAYEQVSSFAIADYTTAATHRVAQIYADLGRSVMSSARPKGLNSEELEMYSLQLEEQAFPFEEKAIEIFEVNARRLGDGIYDDWIGKSLGALAQMNPARYARQEQMEEAFNEVF